MDKITYEKVKVNPINFSEIENGMYFLWSPDEESMDTGMVFLKLANPVNDADLDAPLNAVCIMEGELMLFDEDDKVIPISVDITVKDDVYREEE